VPYAAAAASVASFDFGSALCRSTVIAASYARQK
jgi:hypothetical protein